jgi:hypothetical protein
MRNFFDMGHLQSCTKILLFSMQVLCQFGGK